MLFRNVKTGNLLQAEGDTVLLMQRSDLYEEVKPAVREPEHVVQEKPEDEPTAAKKARKKPVKASE